MLKERSTLTDTDKEKLSDGAHKNEEAIKKVRQMGDDAVWRLSELLLHCKDMKFWCVNYDTWTEFLANPDIGIDDSYARRLVRLVIVRKSLEAQKLEVDWSGISATRLTRDWLPCVRVDEKHRVVLNALEALEILEWAKSLSLGDFKVRVSGMKIKKSDVGYVEPKFVRDMLVFVPGTKTVIGSVRTCRANSMAQYVTIRIDNDYAKLPLAMEIQR